MGFSNTEREEDDSENGRASTRNRQRCEELTNTRTRFLPDGDLLLLGALHRDHATHRSPFHKVYAPTEESRGYTRNGHIDICW
jgi:hypothetical protein